MSREEGSPPDKQYVRNWLKENPENHGILPEDVVTKTAALYSEAYEMLTGGRI